MQAPSGKFLTADERCALTVLANATDGCTFLATSNRHR